MSGVSGFEVRESLEMGRFVIAKKEYQFGDLILDEKPLLIAPFVEETTRTSDQNLEEDESKLHCVGCYKYMVKEKIKYCPECGCPICGWRCAMDSLHTKYECSLFAEKKIHPSLKAIGHIYILRAALMYKDQTNRTPWKMFTSLTSSYGINDGDFLAKKMEEIQQCTSFLNSHFQFNVDSNIVGLIVRTFSINAFWMGGTARGNTYNAKALYSFGCLFAHSCAPNGEWVIHPIDYNGTKRWNMKIYARRKILCGEAINISYALDCSVLSNEDRKKHIANSFNFDCKCLRCVDPTELHFYTEAVVCQFCGDGHLTADDTNDEHSTWTCNHCRGCSEYSYAKTCVEKFKSSIESVANPPSSNAIDLLLTSSNKKYELGENHREKNLAAFLWIQCLSEELFVELLPHSPISSQIFVKVMKRAAKCLTMFRMFGRTSYMVEMEACFARAIAAYYFKTADFCSIHHDPYLPQEKLQILNSICVHLQTAYDTYLLYPTEGVGCVPLIHVLKTGFKFWKEQLETMKNENVDPPVSSKGFLENGTTKVVAQIKTSLGKLWAWGCQLIGNLTNGFNELGLIKPDVSLLTEYDFHFDG